MKLYAVIFSAFGLLPLSLSAQPAVECRDLSIDLQSESLPVIRHSPEFVIHLSDGHEMLLSSLRGKVVALMFVHTGCRLCQRGSQIFTKLYAEYGSRGFEPIEVAFNADAGKQVRDFVTRFGITYPVGYSTPDEVVAYLDRPQNLRYHIPQIVWIDRNGDIRAETPQRGGTEVVDEAYWRSTIEMLVLDPEHATD